MKKVVVMQSNYIPWKGYFDLVNDADLFIFYDDVQYTKNDWRNRNKIKTAQGAKWLSIPTGIDANRLICEVSLSDPRWQRLHWDNLRQQYEKSPYFRLYKSFFEKVYLDTQWTNLSQLNRHLIQHISLDFLRVSTSFADSSQFLTQGKKLDRLLDLLLKSEATQYITGPAAKDYIVPERFEALNIELLWKDYSGYPEYPQRFPPFEHGVSILDLLFNVGPDAPKYIWKWRNERAMA